jgi:hypothetical protein
MGMAEYLANYINSERQRTRDLEDQQLNQQHDMIKQLASRPDANPQILGQAIHDMLELSSATGGRGKQKSGMAGFMGSHELPVSQLLQTVQDHTRPLEGNTMQPAAPIMPKSDAQWTPTAGVPQATATPSKDPAGSPIGGLPQAPIPGTPPLIQQTNKGAMEPVPFDKQPILRSPEEMNAEAANKAGMTSYATTLGKMKPMFDLIDQDASLTPEQRQQKKDMLMEKDMFGSSALNLNWVNGADGKLTPMTRSAVLEAPPGTVSKDKPGHGGATAKLEAMTDQAFASGRFPTREAAKQFVGSALTDEMSKHKGELDYKTAAEMAARLVSSTGLPFTPGDVLDLTKELLAPQGANVQGMPQTPSAAPNAPTGDPSAIQAPPATGPAAIPAPPVAGAPPIAQVAPPVQAPNPNMPGPGGGLGAGKVYQEGALPPKEQMAVGDSIQGKDGHLYKITGKDATGNFTFEAQAGGAIPAPPATATPAGAAPTGPAVQTAPGKASGPGTAPGDRDKKGAPLKDASGQTVLGKRANYTANEQSQIDGIREAVPMIARIEQGMNLKGADPEKLDNSRRGQLHAGKEAAMYYTHIGPDDPIYQDYIPLVSLMKVMLTQPYLRGMRNYRYVQQIQDHMPSLLDTPKLINEKIANIKTTFAGIMKELGQPDPFSEAESH